MMLSLGVGATTALFSLVDSVMPCSTPSIRCETAMEFPGTASIFHIADVPSSAGIRDRATVLYETSVESAGDALGAFPDAADVLGGRPVLALLGACVLGFLLVCARGASGMIVAARAPLVAIGATAGALTFAALSLRALELPAMGMRATAFALCVSLLAVCYARISARSSQRKGPPLTI
ncbi:MAG: hypothetical protein H0U66_16380 [Gemmatimonadaceae bacterium]|nr:hypothetical protein [Gemmatimonadaceae bacterium]